MTALKLSDLEVLAKAAGEARSAAGDLSCINEAWRRYIAAASPDRVLELCAALREAHGAIAETAKYARALLGMEIGSLHPNDIALVPLERALARLAAVISE